MLVLLTTSQGSGVACDLVLPVVGTPTSAAVVASAAIATTESSVVAITALLVLLVTTALLVTQTTESSVLAVPTKVAGVTAEALLVGLLLVQTLSALAWSALSGRSGTTLLGSQGGLAGPSALSITEALQRVVATLLAALLLAIRALTRVSRSAERVGKTAESSGAGCGAVVLTHTGG